MVIPHDPSCPEMTSFLSHQVESKYVADFSMFMWSLGKESISRRNYDHYICRWPVTVTFYLDVGLTTISRIVDIAEDGPFAALGFTDSRQVSLRMSLNIPKSVGLGLESRLPFLTLTGSDYDFERPRLSAVPCQSRSGCDPRPFKQLEGKPE